MNRQKKSLLICGALSLVAAGALSAEVATWRVGDETHPWQLVPVSGITRWGRGWALEILQDADSSTWLSPVRLDSTLNLVALLAERAQRGEYGTDIAIIPSEAGVRIEVADPFNTTAYGGTKENRAKMADGDLFTAYGLTTRDDNARFDLRFQGYYYIHRIVFQPRPSVPEATMRDYWVRYGNAAHISNNRLSVFPFVIPPQVGQQIPVIKDISLERPLLMGMVDILSRHPPGEYWEIAEVEIYGDGYPTDGFYASEIIDLGVNPPGVRRYAQQWDRYKLKDRTEVESQFPGQGSNSVIWGKVRWKARRLGEGGDVRIQFRAGNSLDTHIYQRRVGKDEVDLRDENGQTLDAFSWANLNSPVRVPEHNLPYNELGAPLGSDGPKGWSFWSASLRYEDGLIDETRPAEESGILLPLPGQTRYLQFRIFFDSLQHSAVLFDYLEFEYDVPVVGQGVRGEVFPPQALLGEETTFRYFLKPFFDANDQKGFNRIEIAVPSSDTRIQTLKVDDQPWLEIPMAATTGVEPQRLPPEPGGLDSLGQFAQTIVLDSDGSSSKLLVKLPSLDAADFPPGQERNIEIIFTSTLFNGSWQFTSAVWNDAEEGGQVIPQPTEPGDASPELSTDAFTVVAESLGGLINRPLVAPNPFTPNGDGINDEALITVELFLVSEPIDLTVDLYDLSGRRVRNLGRGRHGAGVVELRWDGRDDRGWMLPPGIYLYHITADADDKLKRQTGILAMLY